jgi:hypothetical protein
MFCKFWLRAASWGALLTFSLQALAATLSTSDEIYLLKAQVATLEKEVAAATALANQERDNIFNPAITVVGDILGQYAFKSGQAKAHEHDHGHEHSHVHEHTGDDHHHAPGWSNGLFVRELEFELRGDIDPWADAMLAVALENHGTGSWELHVEEAFLRFKKWPGLDGSPWGLNTKVGQFKTAFGRMNRIHRHHTTQIDFPMAMKSFLGEEGLSAPGISFNRSWVLNEKNALNLFVEGVMGGGLPMQDRGARESVMGLSHLWWHQGLATDHFLDVGLSGLLGTTAGFKSDALVLLGGDVHYSYLPAGHGQNPVFLLGSEFYTANKHEKNSRWPMGNFTWAQVKLIGSTFLGARYDLAPREGHSAEFQHGISTFFSYYTTEFLRFRLGYEHVMPKMNSFAGDHRLLASMMFVLGSHPVEPYFVTR